MSIYDRDEINPQWEPSPWPMNAKACDMQELGFQERATKPIKWDRIAWNAFPEKGIFGQSREWLASAEAECFATFDSEDLLLIENTWSGWPDPPRYGLASRPTDQPDAQWTKWGNFREIPAKWTVPELRSP